MFGKKVILGTQVMFYLKSLHGIFFNRKKVIMGTNDRLVLRKSYFIKIRMEVFS